MTAPAPPNPASPAEPTTSGPHAPNYWRRRVFLVVGAIWLAGSIVVLVTAQRAASDDEAMGQVPARIDPTETTVVETTAPVAAVPGGVAVPTPAGFTLVEETARDDGRFVARYTADGGDGVITVSTVRGAYRAEQILAGDPDAEAVDIGGPAAVLTRLADVATGETDLLIRWQHDAERNVIVRGRGVELEALTSLAATIAAG